MKNYTITFGSGDPRGFTGLSPTFLMFWNLTTNTTNTPPSIAELVAGKTGIYTFSYGVTQPISFLLDAATTSPGPNGRYVTGQIDPADRIDEYGNTLIAFSFSLIAQGNSAITGINSLGSTQTALGSSIIANLNALGSTLSGIGNTSGSLAALVGSTSSSFGSTLTDPSTLFGYLKRSQEIQEGNNVYTKATGIFQFYSRGSTTLLANKTISDSSTTTTKT